VRQRGDLTTDPVLNANGDRSLSHQQPAQRGRAQEILERSQAQRGAHAREDGHHQEYGVFHDAILSIPTCSRGGGGGSFCDTRKVTAVKIRVATATMPPITFHGKRFSSKAATLARTSFTSSTIAWMAHACTASVDS